MANPNLFVAWQADYFADPPPRIEYYSRMAEDARQEHHYLGEALQPLFARTCEGKVGTLKALQIFENEADVNVSFLFYLIFWSCAPEALCWHLVF